MKRKSLGNQLKSRQEKGIEKPKKYDGNAEILISTGSTLLDLAISGTRTRYGGIPIGIAVEVFGPNNAGKTVLLCEIAGAIQRAGGDLKFYDPEARLDIEFAKLFDFSITDKTIEEPDTVAEVFDCFSDWNPKGNPPHGIIADSIAALSTEGEMKDAKGYDGAKRANDFSVGFRKTCRMIKQKQYLMVFSNQLRDNMNVVAFGKKTKATGGHAPKYYASLRLEISKKQVIRLEKSIHGKKHKEAIGVISQIEIIKSSVDKGYRKADIYIMNDYGIDDVRANLIYMKQNSKDKKYAVDNEIMGDSIGDAIQAVEERRLEKELKENVIDLWDEIQEAFTVERKKKVR